MEDAPRLPPRRRYDWHHDGAITRVAKGGGSLQTILKGLDLTGPLAVDATSVYFVEENHTVRKIALQDGSSVFLGSGNTPSALLLHGSFLYVSFAPDPSVWTDVASERLGEIARIPTIGGDRDRFSLLRTATPIAVDGEAVFYALSGVPTMRLMRHPLRRAIAPSELGRVPTVAAIVADDASVYALTQATTDDAIARLLRFGKEGGLPVVLAEGSDLRAPIAVDATSVYFVARDDREPQRAQLRVIAKGGGAPRTLLSGSLAAFVLDETTIFALLDDKVVAIAK
jgi:hypothetical protein